MRTRHLLDLSKNKITVELKWNVKCDIKKITTSDKQVITLIHFFSVETQSVFPGIGLLYE